MKTQKQWNFVTILALAMLAAGYALTKGGAGGVGKFLILLGGLGVVAGIAAVSRDYRSHPYQCPVCGAAVRPAGRWLFGAGFNGTNTVTCHSCGADVPLQDLKQKS